MMNYIRDTVLLYFFKKGPVRGRFTFWSTLR